MKRWVQYLLIAIFLLLVTLVLIFVPISDYLDFLQGWDSAFAILTFVGTVVFGILGLKKRKEENASSKPEPDILIGDTISADDNSNALGRGAQQINNSTVITGNNSKVEKK